MDVAVYLPPDYPKDGKKANKDYPVVYFLHGWLGSAFQIGSFENLLDAEFTKNPDEAFILVGADAGNKFGGTFYTDSPVSGNWETHFINELIPLIEKKYSINPEKRGLAGFSMGGYGTWELGLKYPGLFCALLAFSPGAFDENGLKDALLGNSWNQMFKQGYSAAFAPDVNDPETADVPVFDGSAADNKLIAEWESGFGNIPEKIGICLQKEDKPGPIKIVVGKYDQYKWILNGSRYLAGKLEENGIPCALEIYTGGHNFNAGIIQEYFIPFFEWNF
ncbi:MAG: alpha/beta hydrolase [Spirochaetales bacterium]|nr:alpha/beta hydrolase [Spirochaetales bacterium]